MRYDNATKIAQKAVTCVLKIFKKKEKPLSGPSSSNSHNDFFIFDKRLHFKVFWIIQ